jgi:hypothetical protein
MLIMLGSIAVSLAGSFEDSINNPVITNSPVDKYPGQTHITISPEILKPLGYNDTSQLPEKLFVQIIRSYNELAYQGPDGDYYCYITPDSPKAAVNLIGTDRICAEEGYVDLIHPPSD